MRVEAQSDPKECMNKKQKGKRSSIRRYRQATGPLVQPAAESDVANLLSGHGPSEASSVLKWNSGKAHVASPNNINWAAAVWLGLIHVGALAALLPWTFSWSGLALVFALHWLCGCVGITLGYHRMLTHGSFNTYPWVRKLIASIGCLAGEGPPMQWVANHRLHHARSDQEGDPHSPNDGGWWSHVFWLAYNVGGKDTKEFYRKWAPDLQRERFMRSLNVAFVPINVSARRLWLRSLTGSAERNWQYPGWCGPFACAWSSFSTARGWSTRPVTCGAIATTRRAMTAATTGGWL